MESDRFDDLSRALGGVVPRQRVVRLLAGIGAAGLAALSRLGNPEPWRGTDALAKKKNGRKKKRKRLCPDNQDKVCHCPPGNTDNCHITGNGAGHKNHLLDCCCTRNGKRTPRCACLDGGACFKREGGICAGPLQCIAGTFCSNIINGRGVCQQVGGCTPLTCADYPGRCGPQDDTCGGETASCTCPNPTDTCEAGLCVACVPLTCADFPDQCGTFADDCEGEIDCACAGGGCCDGVCLDGAQCCQANDCPRQLCQDRACDDGTCAYTPVADGEPGPLCAGQGRFCCNGDACCDAGQVCTGQGCCTPLTCAQDYPGQCGTFAQGCGLPDLDCTCPTGACCDGTCISDEQCCETSECAEQLCQVPECVDLTCEYTPIANGAQGPLCAAAGDFCCNGNQCCVTGDVCLDTGCCTPETFEEACADAGRLCGPATDGCGGAEYDCGLCPSGRSCISGICLAKGGKRCKGAGLTGHPCKGKKCKCKGGRRCHKGKCCEPVGDGSRHCNANSDCCPGLTCIRKYPDQHKVCLRKGAGFEGVELSSPPS